MRPLVILLLVLAATAALGLALWTLGSKPSTPQDYDIAPATPEARRDPGADARLDSGPSAVRQDAQDALVAPKLDLRTEVTSAGASYPNTLQVSVVDPHDVPVVAATVELRQQSGPLGGGLLQLQEAFGGIDPNKPTWRSTTDVNGVAEFRSLAPGNQYVLTATHPKFTRVELPYVNIPPQGERLEILKLAEGYICRGTVYDMSNAPIAGAHLFLDNVVYFGMPGTRSPDLLEAITDDRGYFEFTNVEGGTRNLQCTAKGYGTRIEMNIAFPSTEGPIVQKDFHLDRGHTIRGKVIAPNRNAVPNARVEVYNYDQGNTSRGFAVTDAGGAFRIEDLVSGEYMLTASAAGFSLERMNRVAVDGEPLEIQLAQQGCAQGRVIDAISKQPLSSFNCAVRLVNPGTTIYGRPIQQADFRNAKDGAFELCGLEPGTYVVQASAPEYAPTYSGTFKIDQGMTVGDVLVEISRGGTLRGRVVDATTGEPVSNAEIGTFDNGYIKNPFTDLLGGMMPRNTTQALARTDKDGRFELSMLTPETYQLEISHHGHTTLILKDLKVTDSQELDLGTLEMAHGATVRGVVYGGDGAPLPNAEVHVRATEGYRVFDARSGSDGRYVIESIPAGAYTVSATRARTGTENDPFGAILDMKKSEQNLTVSEGGDHNVDLFLGVR